MNIELKPGDLFAARSQMLLGRAINVVQQFYSSDNKSEYSHTGFIVNAQGSTFEANWRVGSQDFYKAYKGEKVLIARHNDMDEDRFFRGFSSVYNKHYKHIYPFWRLFFFLVPPIAKYVHFLEKPVCSELVAEFLYRAGLRHKNYMGTNVDTLVDEWRIHDDVEIIFEGVLE